MIDHSATPSPTRAPAQGFTLIEVMIVMAIVGLLSAIAIPSYSSYMRRGDLTEGFSSLSQGRVTMEQYYQDNRNYGSGTTCGTTVSGTANFTLSCVATGSGQGYTLTATGVTGKRTAGYAYTIDHTNTKATTSFAGAAQTGKACWLVKATSEC